MKKILFIALCIFFVQMSYGKNVPESVAISVASNFFKQKTYSSDRHIQIKDIKDVYYKGLLTTSVINFEKGGWMIIERDDRSVPVLAYNTRGAFVFDTSKKQKQLVIIS